MPFGDDPEDNAEERFGSLTEEMLAIKTIFVVCVY